MIKIKSLHKFFNKGRQNEIHVINDVSLDLPERGMVAIFGKSGCGKTTLLNVIGGLDGFAEGEVLVAGNDIRSDTDAVRNRYVGYIFQNYNLNVSESCFDNVADALKLCGVTDREEIERRVTVALTNVGMEKYAKRTPDTLSGGQQQRIAIARAIVKNPRIILADEPTGNLDEANTVMIMDLLAAIAKDHLVLLVTHEANLVDYYCDKVIELSDGRVINVRDNENITGYTAKDKNDVFLGELDRHELSDENALIEYYGSTPDIPIRIKIVNHSGKLYVRVDNEAAQILDSTSEVKLREGVYEERLQSAHGDRVIDMSSLPPVMGERVGRLFSFKSSLISGYLSNFTKNKRSAKIMRRCLCLFAAVMVFMSAVFGTAIGDLSEVSASYNHNVFYIHTDKAEISAKLATADKEQTGIDYVRLEPYFWGGDDEIYFHVGNFETFNAMSSLSDFGTNAVYLDVSLTSGMELLAGKRAGLLPEEMLISSAVADRLLEKSGLGYIKDYDDLIGLVSMSLAVDGKSLRVAGVVDSSESAVYLSGITLAKKFRSYTSLSTVALGSDRDLAVEDGKTVLLLTNIHEFGDCPKIGEDIKIQGVSLKVEDILYYAEHYASWLSLNGVEKLTAEEYFISLLKTEQPSLTEGTPEFDAACDELENSRYFEYYDYYYLQMGDFLNTLYYFGELDGWLYHEKGVAEAADIYYSTDYYKAREYKKLHGAYPTLAQYEQAKDDLPDSSESMINYYMGIYEEEFYVSYNGMYYSATYMVSDSDYVTLSKQVGETHPTAVYESPDNVYSVIHSTDPAKTEAWLLSEFEDFEDEYYQSIYTPNEILEMEISVPRQEIVAYLVAIVVMLVLMSVCMYFIMHSSLMNRIKEIGIYRAIGVSRKNLVFKFFIEAAVLFSLTVLLGYIGTSLFIGISSSMSSLVSEAFYYPAWLALCVFGVLFGLSIVCGILPILALLRKTPSEILAKYDI